MSLNPMHLLKLELRTDMDVLTTRADMLTKRDFINVILSDMRSDAKEHIVIELAEKAFKWWNGLP